MDGRAERWGARARLESLTGLRIDTADRVIPPAFWMLGTVCCLLFLSFPLSELLRIHPTRAHLFVVLAGMVIFVGIYLWLMLREPFRAAPLSASEVRMHVLLLAVIAAIVLFLTLTDSVDWVWFVLYANVIAGVKLPVRVAAATIPGLTLLTLGVTYLTLGWRAIDPVFSTVISVSILMIGVSQMVTIIRELRAARQEIARLAVADERLRFARDVHDLLGHSLSTIAIKAALARRLLPGDPERAMHELDDVQAVTQEALREVREAVTGYRQPTLATELANAREVLGAAGIACACDDVAVALPPVLGSVVAWTVREGVTNVVRHSRARRVTIRIRQEGDAISAEITDDGVGSTNKSGAMSNGSGNGLRGLAERAAFVGGRIEAGPCAGGGFRLCVVLPIPSATIYPPAIAERAR